MAKYNTLDEFMTSIDDPAHVQKLAALIQWALDRFPTLSLRIAWNQPMLTDHGTFIIGFSAATNHISIAVEDKTLDLYRDTITQAGYKSSKRLFQMQWDQEWSHELLAELIAFNIEDKQDITTFWR
ncbi:iron chaperone [Lacticaseibacillus saniviri]